MLVTGGGSVVGDAPVRHASGEVCARMRRQNRGCCRDAQSPHRIESGRWLLDGKLRLVMEDPRVLASQSKRRSKKRKPRNQTNHPLMTFNSCLDAGSVHRKRRVCIQSLGLNPDPGRDRPDHPFVWR